MSFLGYYFVCSLLFIFFCGLAGVWCHYFLSAFIHVSSVLIFYQFKLFMFAVLICECV